MAMKRALSMGRRRLQEREELRADGTPPCCAHDARSLHKAVLNTTSGNAAILWFHSWCVPARVPVSMATEASLLQPSRSGVRICDLEKPI